MTRINSKISPNKLCDSHLIAEYREILRVFKLAKKTDKSPKYFTLGKGHVIFFYDKLKYVYERFEFLKKEVFSRGFDPKINFDFTVLKNKENLYNDWKGPQNLADELVRKRILERAKNMKSIRYRGNSISFEDYRKILYGEVDVRKIK